MQFTLLAHPSVLPKAAGGVTAKVERTAAGLSLIYRLAGDLSEILIPPRAEPVRADELWRSTCFELFVRGQGFGYSEFNFSPSGEWAAYEFDSYRSGMCPLDMPDLPLIDAEIVAENLLVVTVILAADLIEDSRIGLSAVVEEKGGNKSYWALAHPDGPPDFHHDACFAASLPPIAKA